MPHTGLDAEAIDAVEPVSAETSPAPGQKADPAQSEQCIKTGGALCLGWAPFDLVGQNAVLNGFP